MVEVVVLGASEVTRVGKIGRKRTHQHGRHPCSGDRRAWAEVSLCTGGAGFDAACVDSFSTYLGDPLTVRIGLSNVGEWTSGARWWRVGAAPLCPQHED